MKGDMAPGPRTARIIIADDHDLVRHGFQRMLLREPDLEVVGEAANGREAVELCRGHRPDLVLMDVRMPKMDGLAATREIKREWPLIAVLIVTTYESPDYLLEAIKVGAAGYVLKDAPKNQLLNAMRRTLNGETVLNQELASQLIKRLVEEAEHQLNRQPQSGRPTTQPAEALTVRELEVLRLLGLGQTNPQIGQTLVISRGTAKAHVQHIIRKLGVSDRTQAAVRATEIGLLDPEWR
jgi:DNA-binding NarL/FixJ family response regulator